MKRERERDDKEAYTWVERVTYQVDEAKDREGKGKEGRVNEGIERKGEERGSK